MIWKGNIYYIYKLLSLIIIFLEGYIKSLLKAKKNKINVVNILWLNE